MWRPSSRPQKIGGRELAERLAAVADRFGVSDTAVRHYAALDPPRTFRAVAEHFRVSERSAGSCQKARVRIAGNRGALWQNEPIPGV